MDVKKNIWMVIWSKINGDFNNFALNSNLKLEDIEAGFEKNNPNYKVIHIGEGALPPKTYRSLPYIENVSESF